MKLKALILNNYDDYVEISEIKAKTEEEAYEKIEGMRHNQEYFIMLNEERWNNLIKKISEKRRLKSNSNKLF